MIAKTNINADNTQISDCLKENADNDQINVS